MRGLWRRWRWRAAIALASPSRWCCTLWCGAGPDARADTHHRRGRIERRRGRAAAVRSRARSGSRQPFHGWRAHVRLRRSDPGRRVRDPARALSGAAILDLLQHGKPLQRLITVTEGMPSIIVEERLAANTFLTGPTPAIAEGLGASRQLQLRARREPRGRRRADAGGDDQGRSTQLWAKRSAGLPGASRRSRRSSLASIVEKETGKAAERPMVAGVYCNRLRIGMKLDADPTVIYPVTKGKPLGRRILRSELNAINGYNTYRERRPAGRADRQSGQGKHRRGAPSGADQGALFRRRRHRRPRVRRHARRAQCQCRKVVCHPPPARRDVGLVAERVRSRT